MNQIFEVKDNRTAKLVTFMLCDCKMKGNIQSVATDTAIKDFYKTLALRKSQLCRDYTLLAFVKLIKSLKSYIDNNPGKSNMIQRELLYHNIALFNYEREIRECHNKIMAVANWLEIKDINNVALIDGQYIYMEDGEEYILKEDCMIARPANPSVGNQIFYLGMTNKELREKTGAVQPVRGWYAVQGGVNYFDARDISVKRWYNLDDYHKQYTMEDDE